MTRLFQTLTVTESVGLKGKEPLVIPKSLKIDPEVRTYPSHFAPLFKVNFSAKELKPVSQPLLKSVKNFMNQGLNTSTYKNFLHVLLYAEEYANEDELNKCTRFDVPLEWVEEPESKGVFPSMNLEGVEDNRPKILLNDEIRISFDGFTTQSCIVYSVDKNRVFFKKSKHFTKLKAVICPRVQFILNRSNFVRGHDCIEKMTPASIARLFPQKEAFQIDAPSEFDLTKADLFNENIADNEEQFAAVKGILNASSGIHPYILFGPPGTGKTVTLVEAISQVFHQIKTAKILVCAPSNAAANLLAVRLLENIPKDSIMRGMSRQYKVEDLPSDLASITKISPSWQRSLGLYHIVVTTLASAGTINSDDGKKMPTNFRFSHVFIDESGQSTETEALFAIARTSTPETLLVLSGDPYQLGPVVKSQIAQRYQFETSLMERLMKTSPLHQKTGPQKKFDSRFITKLIKNFRSHEDLLEVPSYLFYDNELLACKQIENFYLKTAFPLVFHGVRSAHSRDPNSTSLFNEKEVDRVMAYVQKLRWIFADEEIGIISPYRSQVRHIRKKLGDTRIMVGSTEEYQGQERRVIVISTVRSSLGLDNTPKVQNQGPTLGFLTNQRRFNVAVTRAMELLVIVGDPTLLSMDNNWKLLIDFIILNDGYTGYEYNRARRLLDKNRS